MAESTNPDSAAKDYLTPKERSELMAKVKSEDTGPEKLTRSLLHQAGYRFRKNVSSLPGTPDIVLPKYDTVIRVHGCFWHRHDCSRGKSVPSSNQEYWLQKFERNVERDTENKEALQKLGWQVLTVWECKLEKDPGGVVEDLIENLDSQICE